MLCGPNLFIIYVYSKIQDEALVIVELARKALVKAGMLSAHFFFYANDTSSTPLTIEISFFLEKMVCHEFKNWSCFSALMLKEPCIF
jgi:hypothetical protein